VGAGGPLPVICRDVFICPMTGQLEALQWAREHECPWDENTHVPTTVVQVVVVQVAVISVQHVVPRRDQHGQYAVVGHQVVAQGLTQVVL